MNNASVQYLGIPKAEGETGGYEQNQLSDTQIEYIVRDAFLSLETPREVHRLLTPAQRAEAVRYAASKSYHLTHV
ncbi:hypothetical protein HDV00_012472 [Rhizophlyctis rosea]|nr:hypothetical protein HDV00_012472 [Rhizophlyctis rosea]